MSGGDKIKKPVLLADSLKGALAGVGLSDDQPIVRVWKIWDGTVGVMIAENAQPVRLKDRVLFVNVSGSVWSQHLRMIKDELIRRINDALNAELVADITCRIGPVS